MSDSVKYYPVTAKILLTLGGLPLVTYRASIISCKGPPNDERLLQRFTMDYKGASYSCPEANAEYVAFYREQIIDYIDGKCTLFARRKQRVLEPRIETVIDLRGTTITHAAA